MKQIHFLFQNVPECDLLVQFCMTSVRLLCHLVDFCNTSCNILCYAHNNWKPSWSILKLFSSTSVTVQCYLLHTGVFPTGRLDFVFPVPSATFSMILGSFSNSSWYILSLPETIMEYSGCPIMLLGMFWNRYSHAHFCPECSRNHKISHSG